MYLSSTAYPLTIAGNTLGQPVRFHLPKREKKLTLRYACGRKQGTIAQETVEEEILWTPPEELGAEYPGSTRLPVTLVLLSGNGGRMEWMHLEIPSDASPELRVTLEEEAGRENFIQNISRLRVRATAEGRYGAAIQTVRMSCGSLTGEGESLSFDLPQAGEIPVTVRATDSRGAESRWEGTVTVLPYTPPKGGFRNIRVEDGHLLGNAWAAAEAYPVEAALILRQGEKETRKVLGSGTAINAEMNIFLEDGPWELGLEIQNQFETVVVPYAAEPFLDADPGQRALGIGCRGDRTGTVSIKLGVDFLGNPLKGVGQAQEEGDAISLGQGDGRYLMPRLLWENPNPKQAFPTGSVKAEGQLFLIGAAQKADSDTLFWDLGFPGGVLRGENPRTFTYENGTLKFGTTPGGDGYAVPRKIYGLF